MKRLFTFGFALLAFGIAFHTPALAQDASVDPAAYLTTRTALYVEIRSDDAAFSALDPLLSRVYEMSGIPAPLETGFADTVSSLFPGVNFRADVLPWLADRFAVAVVAPSDAGATPGSGLAFVLPVADPAGAQVFIDQMNARTVERDLLPDGGVFFYGGTFSMAVRDGVVWFGAPAAVKQVLPATDQTLSQIPAFQTVRAALPADALVTGFVSGAAITETVAARQAAQMLNPSAAPAAPSPDVLWEAILRLHPAQSPVEDALLKFPPLNGVGFALQADDTRLDVTAVLSLDAQYPAPTLATSTAGAALLGVLPRDSFIVLDSYDVSLLALPVAGLAYLGPAVGSVFTSIVSSLDGTPPPTATPTPTPTPTPPLTADAIIAQVQPIIRQAESLMGISLDDLYSLANGEYAVAVFPGAGPTVAAALYLHSSDPQRLIDIVDHVSSLILTDPTNGTPLVAVEHQTIDGADVALLGVPGAGDRPALGILNGNVLFLTLESVVTKVIASGVSATPPTPALDWRNTFSDAQDALFYLDPRTIDLYALGGQRFPPLPVTAIAGSVDLRDNGLFVLNVVAALAGE